MKSKLRSPVDFDIAAVICLAVLPDFVNSFYSSAVFADSSSTMFEYSHVFVITRALQGCHPSRPYSCKRLVSRLRYSAARLVTAWWNSRRVRK